jgi:hypothetical protein
MVLPPSQAQDGTKERANQGLVSRYSGMTPGKRRAWAIGLIVFFIIMCSGIAYSEWYAYNVNVPRYEKAEHPH